MKLANTDRRHFTEELRLWSNSLIKYKRSNKVWTFCVLSKTFRPPHPRPVVKVLRWEGYPLLAAVQPSLINTYLSVPNILLNWLLSAQLDFYTCLSNSGSDALKCLFQIPG